MRIDFVRRRHMGDGIGYGLCCLVLLLAVWEGSLYIRAESALEAERQARPRGGQTVSLALGENGKVASVGQPGAQRSEIKAASLIIELLRRPWDELFAQIEAASSVDVAVLGIEPDHERGEVRLVLEARNVEGMIAYVQSLATFPQLENVSLVSHQLQHQDRHRAVRFVLAARWSGLANSAVMPPATRKAGI